MKTKLRNRSLRSQFRELRTIALGLVVASTFAAMVHAMHPSEIGTGGQVIRTEMMQRLLPAGGFRNVQVLQIELAPGAEAPHHRDDVAILAYVLEGIVESEPEEGKVSTHNRGDAWWQSPGPHVHLIARNSSKTRRARLLTVLIEKDASAVR